MPKIKGEHVSCKELFFGKQFRRWAFYLLLFFLIMMTVIEVTNLIIEYAGCPKEANMNINFNESIIFPNMTFCMSRDQAWSHFKIDNSKIDNNPEWDKEIQNALTNMTNKDDFLKSNWPTSMVVRAYQAIGTLNSLERESTSQSARKDITAFAHGKKFGGVRKLVKDWLEIIDERNVTFTDFQQKVGVETLKRSLREMTRIWRLDEDEEETRTSVRITWVSLLSLCFQPAPKNGTFKDIEEQGIFFRMMLRHDIENLKNRKSAAKTDNDEECMSLDFHGRPTTLARNMEGKGRVKDGTTEQLCVGRRTEVKVDVRAAYIMLPNNEKPTACRNYDEGDESEFDCRSRCRMEMIRQMCHCTALTLQYLSDPDDLDTHPLCDYEKCGIKAKENFTDKLCADRCLPDCQQLRFNVIADSKGRTTHQDLTFIEIHWGAFEYLKLEQQYVWNWTTFMAAIGGSIGMWLGLSMLSLIQFFVYMTGTVTKKVTKKLSIVHSHSAPNLPSSGASDTGEKRKLSNNPFGGPVATNPFNSPFKDKDGAQVNSKSSTASLNSAGETPPPQKGFY